MKTILFVHQSAELYGSDKALLSLVSGLDKVRFYPVVLIPRDGPLKDILIEKGIAVYIVPLVNLGRAFLNFKYMCFLPFKIIDSVIHIISLLRRHNIKVDIIHSNTIAVLSGAFLAKAIHKPHIWHVHEILEHPAFLSRLFPKFINLFSTKVIANSHATSNWLHKNSSGLRKKTDVIWNGVEVPKEDSVRINTRKMLGIKEDEVVIGLVGRISRLKGQGLLIEAVNKLWGQHINNFHVLIVGNPVKNQEYWKDSLLEKISISPAKNHITLIDFQENIWPIWDACDIGVVPTTEAESFGLVAIEAMATGKPVVASNLGGLPEIIVHGETGFLFNPVDVDSFANYLKQLLTDNDLRISMGKKGRLRQQQLFSIRSYIVSFEKVYLSL